jgi:diguanylate cyclase (GGDEF)-like protein/PAS domain S-box-containing protein
MEEPDRNDHGPQGLATFSRGSSANKSRQGEELYRQLMRQLPNVAVFVFDFDLRLLVAEGEALTHQGLRDTDAEGKLLSDVLGEKMFAELEPCYRAALKGTRSEVERGSEDGDRCFRITSTPLRDNDGNVWAGLTMAQDITDLRASERALRSHAEALERISQRDPLTGLANRALMIDRLEQALRRAGRDGGDIALIFLDLDDFKRVNDTRGHEAGDELLCETAERLTGAVRDVDTVARLGGDEFAVLLEDLSDREEVVVALERIFTSLKRPVALSNQQLYLRVSAGIVVGPRDAATPHALLAAADLAMYRAKSDGGGSYRFFDAAMHRRALDRVTIEGELHHALAHDELFLYYQPSVDLRTAEVVSVEALIRWQHPRRGPMAPTSFIPIAEHSNLSQQITSWVLDSACRQGQAWRDAGMPGFRIAVNASTRDVRGELPALAEETLARTGLPGDALEIEITERLLAEEDYDHEAMLLQLKALGIHVTLDDFGTGWSSLSRLHAFPVETLKIDGSFTRQLDRDGAIARSIISLGHNLGLQVVGEGVETASQLEGLRDADCHAASGFLICPPLAADELTHWLRAR